MQKLLMLFLMMTPSLSSAQNFYDEQQRYRGWLWFEQPVIEEQQNSKALSSKSNNITPEQAREEIEQSARKLEELKFRECCQVDGHLIDYI